MNCRTIKLMAVAIALCAMSAMVSQAVAADKAKGHHGTIVSMTAPAPAKDKAAAVAGSIKVTETDANGAETTTSYDLGDNVEIMIKGETGNLEDLKEGDKIFFRLDADKKVTSIHKGRKKKAAATS